jgi:hypothetical protein
MGFKGALLMRLFSLQFVSELIHLTNTIYMSLRILLDDEDFQKLVKGEVIEKSSHQGERVSIALEDIGYDRMYIHLMDAMTAYSRRAYERKHQPQEKDHI